MTPPPTTTTRADSGRSVVTRHLFQQPFEPARGEPARGLLEALASPAVEVEVDAARGRLDHAPQRPAVRRDEGLQPRPGELVSQRSPEVRRDEFVDLVVVEVALGAGVAELEAGVVVAR